MAQNLKQLKQMHVQEGKLVLQGEAAKRIWKPRGVGRPRCKEDSRRLSRLLPVAEQQQDLARIASY